MADNTGGGGGVVQSFQSDLSSGSSGLSTLTAIAPLLRALSADDVAGMALLQVSEIGSLFHLNGKFADEVPDALRRHKSIRLDRVMHYVGWIRGDAASVMAESAGGRAGAFLCSILVEYYGDLNTGNVLHELSADLLPKNRAGCSKSQLSRAAVVLSKKLGTLGFGTHLAKEATRIREIYLNSNIPIPRSLINTLATISMVKFLKALNKALTDETAVLYVEGCHGMGRMVALLTALCPEDVSISVENEITFRGHRSSVIVSIKANQPVRFWVETALTGDGVKVFPHLVLPCIDHSYTRSWCNLKWDGFLAAQLDILFLEDGYHVPNELRSVCAELIASIALSLSPEDLMDPAGVSLEGKYDHGYGMYYNRRLEAGIRNLLGPYPRNRISDQLKRILTEPSLTCTTIEPNYFHLHRVIQSLVPEEACPYRNCFHAHPWAAAFPAPCPIWKIWDHIAIIIEQGLAALFITPGESATVKLRGFSTPKELRHAILRALYIDLRTHGNNIGQRSLSYTTENLHQQIQELVFGKLDTSYNCIGSSSGSSSIFPAMLLRPAFLDPPYLEYILENGQFHDGQDYYNLLYSRPRSLTDVIFASEILPPSTVTPSNLGCHSNLLITARSEHFGLQIRTLVDCHGKQVEMDFRQLLLGYMGVKVANECSHNPNSPLEPHASNVVVESVDYVPPPLTSRPIAVILTHGSPEARFLACGNGGRTLFMGKSCLNCAVKQAKEEGFNVIIL